LVGEKQSRQQQRKPFDMSPFHRAANLRRYVGTCDIIFRADFSVHTGRVVGGATLAEPKGDLNRGLIRLGSSRIAVSATS
jgi:hypothetical protein